MTDDVELVANFGNFAIIGVPGRRFPGCWVAADTMSTWFHALKEAVEDPQGGAVEEVLEDLTLMLSTYARVRRSEGADLPFEWPESDLPANDIDEEGE
jgi:hypothetical protein